MFNKKNKEENKLALAIDVLTQQLEAADPGSEQQSNIAKSIEVLKKAQSHEKDKSISPDVALTVGGNLAGIIAILSFERVNVIATKALGFVLKSKI